MKYIGYFVTFVSLMLFGGFVLQQLWGWFLVPFGLPELSIAWALGLSQTLGILTGRGGGYGKKSTSDIFIESFAICAAALISGFVIHLFM